MNKWEQRRTRWDAYKNGIKDKFLGKDARSETKSYLEGYNETRPYKIQKYTNP